MASLQEFVIKNVDFKKYYQDQFPEWNGDFNSNVACPFSSDHANGTDSKPSFSININEKGGCHCFSCGRKIGSIIHYEKTTAGNDVVDDETAASRIYSRYVRPVMASPDGVAAEITPWDVALKSVPKVFGSLQTELAISPETIQRFDLGWEPTKKRITIPVFDSFNQLLNVRFYRLPSMRQDPKFPKLLNADGYGSPAQLFPAPQLLSLCSGKHRPPIVYWFSGERDTLKAWDDGIPSFCYTTGENVCKPEWATEIEQFHATVGIVADNDEPGRKGAAKRLEMLKAAGITAFILDLEGDKIKDYSDYRSEGGTVKDFLDYGESQTKNQGLPSKNGNHPPEEEEGEGAPRDQRYYPIPKILDPTIRPNLGEYAVSDIKSNPALLNSPIQIKAIVSGKMDRTFSIPHIFTVGSHTYKLPISREMVQLVREKDEAITKFIHSWLSTKARIKILEYMTVTEVEIIPMIQPGVDNVYVNQRCYFFGPLIECNKPYQMTIVPTSDMKTQETIGLITEIAPVSNILDSYKFDEKSYKKLASEFHPDPDVSIYENLRLLSHVVAEHHTGIRNRDDLHLVGLLSWLSPLQFEFPFEGLQRGWLNTLVLGDTETGKSKVCQKLTSLFQCGVFINAESCSYVGLVGGAVKSSSGMNILRWGKIPLYNRQIVVVEELSGLSTLEISHMSDIRSAGVARYDKAGLTGETSAKTRLMFLSNVRGEGKSLGDYPTGVQAAQALVGHNEDLARFDLALTVTDDEVDGNIINEDRSTKEKKHFDPNELDAFKELVMFAWSLKPDQIDFTLEAYKSCLINTMKMCGVYHSSLPVFKAGSGRLKLARIALAIACIQFSWDQHREKLVVLSSHVDAAAELLDKLYRKPSFGYARYSNIQFSLHKILHEKETLAKIKEACKEKENEFYKYISYANSFTKFDMIEALGIHQMHVERIISQMFTSNIIRKGEERSAWQLSKAGRKWIERIVAAKGI